MTYVPYAPLWCWALQGADQMFFSQPTEAYLGSETLSLADRGACVARCQDETRFVLDQTACDQGDWARGLTPPIQCGHVAREDAEGRLLCDFHYQRDWFCVWCEGALPASELVLLSAEGWSFCSPTCQAAHEAAVEAAAAEDWPDREVP